MSTVADKSAAVKAMCQDWDLAEALLGGTKTMRLAAELYLPKWPKETQEAYNIRLSVAVLFPAYLRTVGTLAAKPFSKPLTVNKDVPASIQTWLKDIDLQGRDVNAFSSDVLEKALGYGLAGILIEYPVKGAAVRTQAQEQAAGLRPYWVEINAKQLLGWRAERVGGVWQVMQLRFMECVEEADGPYGSKTVDQVRVLEPGKWEIHRKGDKGDWVLHDQGITTLKQVPFVPIYAGRYGYMVARPPLLEVAHLNVAHWQCASDQQTILHVARVPILCATGVEDDKFSLEIGAGAAVKLPEGADLKFVEHSGAAIGAGVVELDKLEERMRQAGAELLVLAPGRITATQVMTENAVGLSLLQRITLTFQDALNQCLAITAKWVGEANGGTVTLFNDYGVATLQEASAQLLLETNRAGKLSDETLHSEFQRRGILAAEVSWEVEKDRLEVQGPDLATMVPQQGGLPARGAPQIAGTPTDPAQPPATPPAPAFPVALAPSPSPFTPITPIAPQPGSPVDDPAPAFDVEAFAAAMSAALSQLVIPAPIVNVAAPTMPDVVVNVAPAAVTVNVPEQPPAQVTVHTAPITVEGAQITVEGALPAAAPVVNVAPAAITVNTPPVSVTIEKGPTGANFIENDDGDITGIKLN
jgi:hypothetical protein